MVIIFNCILFYMMKHSTEGTFSPDFNPLTVQVKECTVNALLHYHDESKSQNMRIPRPKYHIENLIEFSAITLNHSLQLLRLNKMWYYLGNAICYSEGGLTITWSQLLPILLPPWSPQTFEISHPRTSYKFSNRFALVIYSSASCLIYYACHILCLT